MSVGCGKKSNIDIEKQKVILDQREGDLRKRDNEDKVRMTQRELEAREIDRSIEQSEKDSVKELEAKRQLAIQKQKELIKERLLKKEKIKKYFEFVKQVKKVEPVLNFKRLNASKGFNSAKFDLGKMYVEGYPTMEGIITDVYEGSKLIKSAADNNYVEAIDYLILHTELNNLQPQPVLTNFSMIVFNMTTEEMIEYLKNDLSESSSNDESNVENSPVAWYKFEKNLLDSSRNQFHIKTSAQLKWRSGVAGGYSLSILYPLNEIIIADQSLKNVVPVYGKNMSISVWTYDIPKGAIIGQYHGFVAANSTYGITFGKGDGVQLFGDGQNDVKYSWNNRLFLSEKWNSWVFTFESSLPSESIGKIYLNGKLVATGNIKINSTIPSTPILIGSFVCIKCETQFLHKFVGVMDELKIFDYCLSQEQIINISRSIE